MGARCLRNFIEQPLMKREDIEKRLNAVESLTVDSISRDELREYLNAIYDLERLLSKVSYQSVNPKALEIWSNEALAACSVRLDVLKLEVLK